MIWLLGTPASGTTLHMDMLEAGGAPVFYDADNTFRESWAANNGQPVEMAGPVTMKIFGHGALIAMRAGIFPDRAFVTGRDPAVSRRGWERRFPAVPPELRDPRLPYRPWLIADPDAPEGAAHVCRSVLRDRAVAMLAERGVPMLALDFDRAVDDPRSVCEEMAAFVGLPLDIDAMVAVPDPSRRHFVSGD